jgi:hypothetical protein
MKPNGPRSCSGSHRYRLFEINQTKNVRILDSLLAMIFSYGYSFGHILSAIILVSADEFWAK